MIQAKLSEAELQRLRAEFCELAKSSPAAGREDEAACARFSLDSPAGHQLYESFTDEELLALLREVARRLGRSPAQGETYCAFKSYLRARFKNWPTALRLADLSRSAGSGGKPLQKTLEEQRALREALGKVRETAAVLGRMPHPSDLPDACEALKKRYQTWGEVLAAAGALEVGAKSLYKIEDLEENYLDLLRVIRAKAEALNRAPQRGEVDAATRTALIRRCGSWRNALYQIGLEPVRRITPFAGTNMNRDLSRRQTLHSGTLHDCYYRILHMDVETEKELALVRDTARRLGHPPTRHEVPPEMRRHLQAVCGSWSNTLYQLSLQAEKAAREESRE